AMGIVRVTPSLTWTMRDQPGDGHHALG
ncbi:MAG: hypothetical protein RL385_3752, partial [Pseudomonadota bacterium]